MPNEPRIVRPMMGGEDRMMLQRSRMTIWSAKAVAGTEAQDLLDPEYWKHQAFEKKIKVRDIIEAYCEDDSWDCSYIVRSVDTSQHPKWLKLEIRVAGKDGVIRYGQGVTTLPSETETHFVKFIPSVKWVVKRKSDGEMEKKNIPNKPEAIIWMHSHYAQLAA